MLPLSWYAFYIYGNILILIDFPFHFCPNICDIWHALIPLLAQYVFFSNTCYNTEWYKLIMMILLQTRNEPQRLDINGSSHSRFMRLTSVCVINDTGIIGFEINQFVSPLVRESHFQNLFFLKSFKYLLLLRMIYCLWYSKVNV